MARCYAVPWTRLLPVTLSGDCEIVALRQRELAACPLGATRPLNLWETSTAAKCRPIDEGPPVAVETWLERDVCANRKIQLTAATATENSNSWRSWDQQLPASEDCDCDCDLESLSQLQTDRQELIQFNLRWSWSCSCSWEMKLELICSWLDCQRCTVEPTEWNM